uniref:Variant surface glycoprotein 388 n=1 Tax=Trypanosoma brucei TaxID=5691 RepID=M4SX49_9TRYP|nr:variant surface glycoprotein 388 [Trypanosoma brucei]
MKAQYSMVELTKVLFVAAEIIFHAESVSAEKNKAAKAVNHPCAEKRFDEILADNFEWQVKKAEHKLEAAANDITSWKILREQAVDPQTKAGLGLLIAYLELNAKSARTSMTASQQTLQTAAILLRQRAANISTLLALHEGTTISRGTPTLGGSPTTPTEATVTCKYGTAKLTLKPQKCNGETDGREIITEAEMALPNIETLPVIEGDYTTAIGISVETFAKGSPQQGSSSVTHEMCQTTGGASANLGGTNGLGANLAITTAPAATAKQHSTNKEQGGKCPHDPLNEQSTDIQRLVNAVCQARHATVEHAKTSADLTYEGIKSDTNLRQLAALALLQQGATVTDITTGNEALSNAIAATLGPDETAFKAKYITPLTSPKLEINLKSGKIEGSIAEIASKADAGTVLAYFIGVERGRAAAAAKTTTAQMKEEECAVETDKVKCNKENGCKYNEKDNKCEGNTSKATTAGESTSKCSEKKTEGECKSPDCKCENNACKDSSFLANKKLDLVADASVGFIYF